MTKISLVFPTIKYTEFTRKTFMKLPGATYPTRKKLSTEKKALETAWKLNRVTTFSTLRMSSENGKGIKRWWGVRQMERKREGYVKPNERGKGERERERERDTCESKEGRETQKKEESERREWSGNFRQLFLIQTTNWSSSAVSLTQGVTKGYCDHCFVSPVEARPTTIAKEQVRNNLSSLSSCTN